LHCPPPAELRICIVWAGFAFPLLFGIHHEAVDVAGILLFGFGMCCSVVLSWGGNGWMEGWGIEEGWLLDL
jgi:hypothetical protein